LAEGCAFSIAAKRSTGMWRPYSSIDADADAWAGAEAMPGAQVAPVDY